MKRFLIAVTLTCATLSLAKAQEKASATDATANPEIAAAMANAALMKVRPEWLSGPEPEFPQSEKALGHNGKVRIRGVLGVDGKLSHLAVAESSKAEALDASALKAAAEATYAPAKDGKNAPIPILFGQIFDFDNYRSADGVGAAKYMCRQFVLDMDWWKQAHAQENFRRHEFYTMTRGLTPLVRLSRGETAAKAFSGETNDAFDKRWAEAIETCRQKPNARFADAFKPEGDYILSLENNQRKNKK